MFTLLLHPVSPLLAVAADGEDYGKALAAAVSVTLIVVLLASRLFGELSIRIGLPPVLGDLVAGVVLGVSALHYLVLEGGADTEISADLINLVHLATGTSIEVVTEVFEGPVGIITERGAETGVAVLLFTIGLESDLNELLKVGAQAAIVAVVGITLPFFLGFLGLTMLFGVSTLPALFAGAALTATSIGITAKVMQDIGVLKSAEGQIILGAAILDDIFGILILAVVVSIVEKGQVEVSNAIYLIVSAAILVLGAFLLNRYFGPWYAATLAKLKNPDGVFIGAVIFGSGMALLSDAAGLGPILGAFAAGLALGGTEKRCELEERFKPLVALFATVFFVSIGAQTDLTVLNPAVPENREGLEIAAFLIVVAILGKAAAGFFVISENSINRMAIGTGMIPRGEVGLVFAGLGAATGGLSPSLEAG
ncbi:MAG: cation:proton antiporter [Xenococcaceae cyanobacterium]